MMAAVTPFKMYKKMAAVAVPKAVSAISQKLTRTSTAIPKFIVVISLSISVKAKPSRDALEEKRND